MKLSLVVVLASLVLTAFLCAFGQPTQQEIVIEVKDGVSQPFAASERYVSGYHSSVDGERFTTIHRTRMRIRRCW